MAISFSEIHASRLLVPGQPPVQPRQPAQSGAEDVAKSPFARSGFSMTTPDRATELIMQRAMARIEEMFAPHLGEGAVKKAVESGLDTSPEATAKRILGFATKLIGRVEARQSELPIEQQSSRAQLFENIQTGIERGFADARAILEGFEAMQGDVEKAVNDTYALIQSGLNDLASTLGLDQPAQPLAA